MATGPPPPDHLAEDDIVDHADTVEQRAITVQLMSSSAERCRAHRHHRVGPAW
jgi:hypothetical protein